MSLSDFHSEVGNLKGSFIIVLRDSDIEPVFWKLALI